MSDYPPHAVRKRLQKALDGADLSSGVALSGTHTTLTVHLDVDKAEALTAILERLNHPYGEHAPKDCHLCAEFKGHVQRLTRGRKMAQQAIDIAEVDEPAHKSELHQWLELIRDDGLTLGEAESYAAAFMRGREV
jgi:hypothetical protein